MRPDVVPEEQKVLTPGDPPYCLSCHFAEGRLSEQQVQAIKQKQLYLICYGLLRYTDFADREHDLQFSYGYIVPDDAQRARLAEGWRMAGPPGYNKST